MQTQHENSCDDKLSILSTDSATWALPICTTANFFSRGGFDRPYFLMFLSGTEASLYVPKVRLHLPQRAKIQFMIKNCYKETHIFCIFPCHFQFLIWIGLLLWANSTRHKINTLFPEKAIPYFEHVIVHIKALGQALASNQS